MPMPQARRVDRAAVRAALADSRPDLTSRTNTQVDTALGNVNQDGIYDAERGAWTVTVWDRKSPINGVDAQHFLNRDDVPADGDVYLLSRNGQVVMFQPHDPTAGGLQPIPAGQGQTRGKAHADVMAADAAVGEIVRQTIANLDNA